MHIDLIKSKKFPRLFLAHPEEDFQVMPGMTMLLPSRQIAPVYDVSFAGIAISSAGLVGILKPGHYFPATLRFAGHRETVSLKLRVIRVTAKVVGFVFDTIANEGRLNLEQGLKDQMVVCNMRRLSTSGLQQGLHSDVWFHGPFDTNIFIWNKKDSQGIHKLVVEYDNLIWNYVEGKVDILKSVSATDEGKGYAAPYMDTASKQKVSMGASWIDRLIKLVGQIPDPQGDLSAALQILKLQRIQ